MVGAAALMIILSALNGFEKTIFTVYETYYPDIRIKPVTGKTIPLDTVQWNKLKKIKGVVAVEPVIEENAILSNNNQQVVALVKGVTSNYGKIINLNRLVKQGNNELTVAEDSISDCWMANGLYNKLTITQEDHFVHALTPNRESFGVAQMETSEMDFIVAGLVDPGDELNQKLCIINFKSAATLFNRAGVLSQYEIKIDSNASISRIKKEIQNLVGKSLKVQERKEQNEAVYKMFSTEKWVAFALLAFVLLIISFNLIGSLSMLVMEKKKDIQLLKNIGLKNQRIKRIFFNQGVLIAVTGTFIGMALGIGFVLLQLKFGLLKTNALFALEYPVELRLTDVFLILTLSIVLGISSTIYPAMQAAKEENKV